MPPQIRPPIRPGGPFPVGLTGGNVLALRALVALLLALGTGAWLSRRFTRPLTKLAEGAAAYESGNLGHRISMEGSDEFSHVAEAMNQMAETVSGQIGRLEEDAKRRRQFLADIAHELRGPVTTMRTMAGALQDGLASDPERMDRAAGSLVRTSDRLLRLVTDLLELSKLDLRELPINRQEVDIRELAAAAISSHAASALQAGITLHAVAPGASIRASIDPNRITQVLDNLLDNAISYAGEGAEVRVAIEDGDPLRLIITDTGRGIPADHLPNIFEPFYRADPARTPDDAHSGLGLRIARGIVEAHGGTLEIGSVEGVGTRAVINLPY